MSIETNTSTPWSVADFFSCGGGTSAGFTRRSEFAVVGAVDLEVAKPSGGPGTTDCNATYQANHGITPLNKDMMALSPEEFAIAANLLPSQLNVMISCAPCTHLSRANPENHLTDRLENTLIGRSAQFATWLRPELFFMENARELITGNYTHHHQDLVKALRDAKYDVRSDVHFLDRFGLPQVRERALVIASRVGKARTLEELWDGWEVRPEAVTVRSALKRLAAWKKRHPFDPEGDSYPGMSPSVAARVAATPPNGGGWIDVARNPDTRHLLTKTVLKNGSRTGLDLTQMCMAECHGTGPRQR